MGFFCQKRGSTKCSESFRKSVVNLMISLLTIKAKFSEPYITNASRRFSEEF